MKKSRPKVLVCILSVTCATVSVRAAESGPVRINVCAERDRNILRNGSFEFANVYNGMKTIIDQGDTLTATWAIGQKRAWCDLGLEQWWGEGATNVALFARSSAAHSGKTALAVTAPGVATTWLAYAQESPKDGGWAVTLSWQAKGTEDAVATASVALYEGATGLSQERKKCEGYAPVELKGGGWRRGVFTLEIPDRDRKCLKPAFCVKFAVKSGTVTIDDVQLEYGRTARSSPSGRATSCRSRWRAATCGSCRSTSAAGTR
ncbi:MAG: hypothetical protein KBT68_07945 [bacterium]|nr:hypothetical protein [Candidatus Colisoma equi]